MTYRLIVIAGMIAAGSSLDAQQPRADSTTGDSARSDSVAAWRRHHVESRLARGADDSALPWVLWTSQGQYFAAACSGALQIPADRRLYARDENTLRRLGYMRASAQREDCTVNQVIEHADRIRAARRR